MRTLTAKTVLDRSARPGQNAAVWTALAAALLFQAWAYYFRLPLSLGPRVILQPWLMAHGYSLYEQIADLHTPLMPLLLSFLSPLFRNGFELARAADVVLVTLTAFLTFALGCRKAGPLGGLWAAGFFIVWSNHFMFNKLWHEAFLAPLYLLPFFLRTRPAPRGPSVPRSFSAFWAESLF
jgi:hypothetical protein